jgi:hypothetical protein
MGLQAHRFESLPDKPQGLSSSPPKRKCPRKRAFVFWRMEAVKSWPVTLMDLEFSEHQFVFYPHLYPQ